MVTTYSVTVYRSKVAAEFLPGGQGYRWMDKVRLAMHSGAVAKAPARSGTLKASHRSFARGFGGNRVDVRIVNTAEHAEWVHEGTKMVEPIEPVESEFLWVPIREGSLARTKRPYVRGQHANPWLDEACTAVALSQGAVVYG